MPLHLLTDDEARQLRQLLAWFRQIRGPGVTNTPFGASFSLPPETEQRPVAIPVIPLKLTKNETGGGWYGGTNLAGFASVTSGASTLSLPLSGTVTNRNVLVFNPPENNGSGLHSLGASNSGGVYGAGLIVGTTTETPSRPVAMFLGASNLFIPVTLTGTGSDGGSASTVAYTYTAVDYLGHTLAAGVSPAHQRIPLGSVKKATIGIWNTAPGTNSPLWWTDEVENIEACS